MFVAILDELVEKFKVIERNYRKPETQLKHLMKLIEKLDAKHQRRILREFDNRYEMLDDEWKSMISRTEVNLNLNNNNT